MTLVVDVSHLVTAVIGSKMVKINDLDIDFL